MFERILVPVDGSEHALSALDFAVELQRKFNSELLLLCVYRHYSRLEASMYVIERDSPEDLAESMREHAKGVVEDAKKHAAELDSKKLRAFVKSGAPARTIVNFAKDRNVSLIVLGSRGMGDVEGFLLGSVSHKVTSLARCPVLVV
ncbi:MAG TPA: universal stress protein [Gammaproteobacteria bacterium]|nr:universal stress protein [Gammaproteobacteria bacterium]